jgi:tetratricopeptide (TPR) repeat protein
MKLLLILLSPLFTQGNEYYAAGQYTEAAQCYEQCLNTNEEDGTELTAPSRATVLYNLGNARFKEGELAQAILAYERSLRLDPQNKDTRYNLEFARSRITDNIEDNRTFFFASWAQTVRNLLTEKTWFTLSVTLFCLMLIGLILFALGRVLWLRKTAFHSAWICLLISAAAGTNAWSLRQRDTLRAEAVITQGVLNAKSSPDQSGTDLFTLHEGTKVEISETLGEWCNIRVGNNEGWVNVHHLERI